MREFELLQHIYDANPSLSPSVTLPPGDDMGALRLSGHNILVTVDQIADQVHFDLKTTSLERIARKAITRNLSDVAAMAARPVGAVCAAALPRSMSSVDATRLFDAMRQTAQHYACPLFGGDTTLWDNPLLLSVTVLAEPWPGIAPVLRSGAKPGDVVCVTGALGGSLEPIQRDNRQYIHHLDFEPRVELARLLAERVTLHAMIDISDGLGRDLAHIARASHVSASIFANQLPISPAAKQAAARLNVPPWARAISDGEDYELCFTLSSPDAQKLPESILGVPITRIGQIGPAAIHPVLLQVDDKQIDVSDRGWEHST
jgi:thiamine-monophosphate kinase